MTMDNANAWVVIIVAVTGGLTTVATTVIGILTYWTKKQLAEVHTVVNSNLTKKEAEIELLRNMLVGSELQAKVAESARAMLAEQAAKALQAMPPPGPMPVVVVPAETPLPVTIIAPPPGPSSTG